MIFGQQQPRQVCLAAADVRMQIDAARHHDHALRIVVAIDGAVGGRVDDAAIADIEVAQLAVDAVRGIVDAAASESRDAHAGLPVCAARAASASARCVAMDATVGSATCRAACSGTTTDVSTRNRWPSLSMPGVATGMKIVFAPRVCGSSAEPSAGVPSTIKGVFASSVDGGGCGSKLAVHSNASASRAASRRSVR
ncbi:conserved hypothetical protein [Ricinus communis]|uniref:Uncharacterized protein n=1 Tax=Ricinus communis TaxID=3988 RepID=B9TQN3_RICCO|nr:conserved hypothetical protein [Ricinus communis]